MAKRAADGIDSLLRRTKGEGGKVTATVVVDQVYAQMQHEALEFRHPRGGQAKYLTTPLLTKNPEWLEAFAQRLLDSKKALHTLWGEHVGEGLRDSVSVFAPVLFNDLRRSAALRVTDGASVVRDDPPEQPRLSDAEAEAKSSLRRSLDGE